MKITFINLSITILLIVMPINSHAEKKELTYPNAVNKLFVDTNKAKEYKLLAQSVGFEINKQYTYREYSDISHKNKVGAAGAYDFLLLSTGGNEWDYDALKIMNKEKCGWEMTYYSNHDLTIIHDVCHDDSRTHTFVRIIKVGKGKNTNLHLE